MATVTEVTSKFVNEPMGKKLVNKVPGIGDAIAKKLNERDIVTAKDLYKYYLDHSEDEFKELVEECGGNALNQKRAYNAMDEWHKQHGTLK